MRILIFGPNGSGKGTQSSYLQKTYQLAHVESGGIFRENIKGGTELGKQAKAFIDRGDLVPDSITIPMIIDRLGREDCRSGWILDGFPRNPDQAKALVDGLRSAGTPLDAVIVIEVARETAKARLLGRRNCPQGHANNIAIEAIKPEKSGDAWLCRVCGETLSARADDIDEAAIDKRLDIYFDSDNGTVAAVNAMATWAEQENATFVRVDGEGDIESVRGTIVSAIKD